MAKEDLLSTESKKALDVNLRAFDLGYKSAFDNLCQSVECVEREID